MILCRLSSASQASGLARIWLGRKNADGTSSCTDNEVADSQDKNTATTVATTVTTTQPASGTDQATSTSNTTVAAAVEVSLGDISIGASSLRSVQTEREAVKVLGTMAIVVLGTMFMISVPCLQGTRHQGCQSARYHVYKVLGSKDARVLGTKAKFLGTKTVKVLGTMFKSSRYQGC